MSATTSLYTDSNNKSSSSSSPTLSISSTAPSSDMSDEAMERIETKVEVPVVVEEEELPKVLTEEVNSTKNNKELAIDNSITTTTATIIVDDSMILDEEDSSEVEIVEQELDEASTSKRKLDDPKPASKDAKKAKTSTSKAPAVAKSAKAESKKALAAKAKENEEVVLVELKNGKLGLKQKALGNDSTSSTMRGRLAFTDYFAGLSKDETVKVEDWPVEHHGVVGRLIHESDKTITALVKHVQKQLVEYIEGSMAAGEDSQESQEKDKVSTADRIPIAELKTLIESLATRTNYGLDVSDLPSALPKGVTEIPAGLQIWRWEIHNSDLLPAELEAKLERRKAERSEAKSASLGLFFALPSIEQKDLLCKNLKKGGGGWKFTGGDLSSDAPAPSSTPAKSNGHINGNGTGVANGGGGDGIASGSGSTPATTSNGTPSTSTSTSKPKTIAPPSTPATASASTAKSIPVAAAEVVPKKKKAPVEKVEKVLTEEEIKAKADKEAEKEARKVARDLAAAEKAARAAEKKDKEDKKKAKELAKEKETSKQSGFFNKFFVKKSISPGPASSNRGSSVPAQTSAFEKTFLPFAIRSNTTVAPVNRFKKYKTGKFPELKINSLETLAADDSIQAFLSDVPRSHLLPAKNAHPVPKVSVRETVRAINDAEAIGADSSEFYRLLADRKMVKVKMLKFKDDVRPGYLGTWTKTSKVVGPRTPFGKDTHLLRYDYDSEEEWEEEEPDLNAENLDSGGELSVEEDSDALSDDWLCEDDEVDYEAGHEGGDEDMIMMDVDGDGDIMIVEARKKILDRENKSKAAKEAARKRKNAGPMMPLIQGPIWESSVGVTTSNHFSSMRIQFLNDPRDTSTSSNYTGYNPETQKSIEVVVKVVDIAPTTSTATSTSAVKKFKPVLNAIASSSTGDVSTPSGPARIRAPAKALPLEHLPRLVELLHNSSKTKALLIEEIFAEFKDFKVAKNTVSAAISEISTKGKGKNDLFIVNSDILAQHGPAMVID